MELTWPLGIQLQSCDALDGRGWGPVDARGFLATPMEDPARFFRLNPH